MKSTRSLRGRPIVGRGSGHVRMGPGAHQSMFAESRDGGTAFGRGSDAFLLERVLTGRSLQNDDGLQNNDTLRIDDGLRNDNAAGRVIAERSPRNGCLSALPQSCHPQAAPVPRDVAYVDLSPSLPGYRRCCEKDFHVV
jgi:hypothetical protein